MGFVIKKDGQYLTHEKRGGWTDDQRDGVEIRQTSRAQRVARQHGGVACRLSDAHEDEVHGIPHEKRQPRAALTLVAPPSGEDEGALELERFFAGDAEQLDGREQTIASFEERERQRRARQEELDRRHRELTEKLNPTGQG